MNRLLDIGFESAGHWHLKDGDLVFELSRHASQRNILYAFVSDGQVKYVGKTVKPLCIRMAQYKKPGLSQSTNINNRERIKALLLSDAAVEILALPDNGLLHYGPFHLNLAAGLEDDIIRIIDPEWNGGKRSMQLEPPAEDTNITSQAHSTLSLTLQPPPVQTGSFNISVENADCFVADRQEQVFGPMTEETKIQPIRSFALTLQPTYLKTGFFNVGVANADCFGADGQNIEIFCGSAEQPILGVINRGANMNGAPRIMGGAGLRDWFEKNVSVKQEIKITVFSPTAIRVSGSGAGKG